MHSHHKNTILIIDDETESIKLINSALKPDYFILFSRDGKSRIENCRRKVSRPDSF